MTDTNEYNPLETLEEEVERFFKTNTFTGMLVTHFYVQARCVISDCKRLQAENEKLKQRLVEATEREATILDELKSSIKITTSEYQHEIVSQARADERARIKLRYDIVLRKIEQWTKRIGKDSDYASGVREGLVIAEKQFRNLFVDAITADQPTQKSCEGCEHYTKVAPCRGCLNYSKYQARK